MLIVFLVKIVGVKLIFLYLLSFQEYKRYVNFWQKYLGVKLAFTILRKLPCL